jgi:hypothetical protein
VLDAILMERRGIPAVAIVTAPFRKTGDAMAVSWGLSGYPFLDIRHPIGNLAEPDLDKIADALADEIEHLLAPAR